MNKKMYEVDGFCEDHELSRAFLYKLWKQGKGPKKTKIGRKTLISEEAAAEWRARMESESN